MQGDLTGWETARGESCSEPDEKAHRALGWDAVPENK
jgi:hypothetical protein